MNILLTIINATPIPLIGFLFVVVHVVFSFWMVFAYFVAADKTYLKLDKFIKKRGMFGVLILLQVFMMMCLMIYAVLLILVNLGFRW